MRNMPRPAEQKSAMFYLLKGLIPYSRENLQLSFHPHKFFNELERNSGYKHKSFLNVVTKAERRGYIKREAGLIKLTAAGKQKAQPFVPSKLKGDSKLMIIFDIPEDVAGLRQKLRLLLREWRFTQAQKSVWISDLDYRKELVEATKHLQLEKYVQIYESARLHPK